MDFREKLLVISGVVLLILTISGCTTPTPPNATQLPCDLIGGLPVYDYDVVISEVPLNSRKFDFCEAGKCYIYIITKTDTLLTHIDCELVGSGCPYQTITVGPHSTRVKEMSQEDFLSSSSAATPKQDRLYPIEPIFSSTIGDYYPRCGKLVTTMSNWNYYPDSREIEENLGIPCSASKENQKRCSLISGDTTSIALACADRLTERALALGIANYDVCS